MVHAHVNPTRWLEQAVIELLLIWFGLLGRISDRVTVFVFSVTSIHGISHILAWKEGVTLLGHHLCMTHLKANGEVLALPVTVT